MVVVLADGASLRSSVVVVRSVAGKGEWEVCVCLPCLYGLSFVSSWLRRVGNGKWLRFHSPTYICALPTPPP